MTVSIAHDITRYMGRMIFDLTDDDREKLEVVRKQRGHRSHAETLRELIRQAASSGLPTPARQAEMKAAVKAWQEKSVSPELRAQFGPIRAKPGALLKGKK